MTSYALVLAAVAVVAAVVDWIAVWSGGPAALRAERIAKPLVMVALVALVATWPADSMTWPAVRPWLLAALAASLAGDLLLLPPSRFVVGVAAFLLAHLAYLGAFLQLPGSVPWLVVGLAGALVVAVILGPRLVRAAGAAGFGVPVALYAVAICAMAVAATRTGIPAAVVGAWLFVASDSMLAWARFVPAGDPPGRARGALRVGVMPAYHVGQVLLVVALLG